MTTAKTCPECGEPLPADGPPGLCMPCLTKPDSDSDAEDIETTRQTPPVKASESGKPQSFPDLKAVDESGGRYTYLGERAKGGMGRVILVHDEYIERDIALKELLPRFTPGSQGQATPLRGGMGIAERFLREARVTGRLEHPSILPVYELGRRENGSLYYTMKLVRGQTLSQAIEEAGTLQKRLKLLPHFVDLCHAIAYAHSRGIIHRDVKPPNVMVGEFGETVVIDWGLAKVISDKSETRPASAPETPSADDGQNVLETIYGQAMGTPAYMAPEQARGEWDNVDERADIYSLGAVLYEILTGEPPFTGDKIREVIERVTIESPPPIHSLERKAPRDLTRICEKAMARDPAQRIDSASAIAKRVELRSEETAYINPFRPTLTDLVPEFGALNKKDQAHVWKEASRKMNANRHLTARCIDLFLVNLIPIFSLLLFMSIVPTLFALQRHASRATTYQTQAMNLQRILETHSENEDLNAVEPLSIEDAGVSQEGLLNRFSYYFFGEFIDERWLSSVYLQTSFVAIACMLFALPILALRFFRKNRVRMIAAYVRDVLVEERRI